MLKRLKVRTRLFLLLGITTAALLSISVIQMYTTRFSQDAIDSVFLGGVEEAQALAGILRGIGIDLQDTIYRIDQGKLGFAQGFEAVQRERDTVLKAWKGYTTNTLHLGENLVPIQQKLVEEVSPWIKRADELFQKLQDCILHQEKEKMVSLMSTEFYAVVEPITPMIGQLIHLHIQDTRNDYREATTSARRLSTTAFVVIAAALLFSFSIAILIIQSITKPLEYIVERVNCVAEGDISIDIDDKVSGGELGSLLSAVKNMIMQMRRVIGEIKGEVHALTSSSQEILASLAQLSTGAQETAAAVTETTTTVEELKQTAHLSAEKAKDVLTSSDETTNTVKVSEQSVVTTIEDMKQIEGKMQIISDSILKLSEKGLAIAEIMNSVNDLAEQSNLLAVNAAIEAAKAGEQGRSFGVVAQEIRSLAEQSKQATVQVRHLLGEIQNATSAAVLATEQGSKAVTKGVSQSLETNKAIKEMVENTTNAVQAANQIVLSSQQQLVGVDQVTTAMTNIDGATSLHVGQLDQIKLAVEGLNSVSGALKQLTDLYKV